MSRSSRNSTTRDTATRPAARNSFQGTLYVPREKIPKGVVYQWVREYLLGEPDDNNVENRLRSGWAPVPADRHPELVAPVLPGRERTDHGVIRRGGLILCQMSEVEYKARRAELQEETEQAMRSTAWTRGELQDDDKRMPMVELAEDPGMNQTSIERVVALPDK